MRNICITRSNKKLNKNLPYYSSELVKLFEFDTKNSIYKTYYSMNKTIDTFILNSSLLNAETLDFIKQFDGNIKFILYKDEDIDIPMPESVYVILDPKIQNKKPEDIQLPKHIINDKIYNEENIQETKLYDMVCFLDNQATIPQQLNELLYPNTSLKIRLFNGSGLQHYQNLGEINENERKEILLESKTLLYINPDYICEAMMCGCSVADISSDNPDIVFNNINNPIMPENLEFTTYAKIIEDFIL